MAIPQAFSSGSLLVVQNHFETLELSDLLPLEREDAYLIGAFIQVFNFIELNLRRSLEVFCSAGLVERTKHFQTYELVKLLKTGLKRTSITSQRLEDTLGKLDEIEFRRPFRNLLAHWAAKRIPGHDAIVLLTMDTKDALSVGINWPSNKDHCTYSIMMLPDLRGLLQHVSKYDEWLAHQVSEWHTQLSNLGLKS